MEISPRHLHFYSSACGLVGSRLSQARRDRGGKISDSPATSSATANIFSFSLETGESPVFDNACVAAAGVFDENLREKVRYEHTKA